MATGLPGYTTYKRQPKKKTVGTGLPVQPQAPGRLSGNPIQGGDALSPGLRVGVAPIPQQPFDFNTAAAQLPQMAQQPRPTQQPQQLAGLPTAGRTGIPQPGDLRAMSGSASQPLPMFSQPGQFGTEEGRSLMRPGQFANVDQLPQFNQTGLQTLGEGLTAAPFYRGVQQGNADATPEVMMSQGRVNALGQQRDADAMNQFGARPAPQNTALIAGARDASLGDVRLGPKVGTEGLGGLPDYAAMNQAANAQQRARYEQFMDQAKAGGASYAQGWNPQTNRNEKQPYSENSDRSAVYAIKQNRERHQRLGDEKRLAQRAAVYGRANGLPQAAATAGIQGMDSLASDPNYQPTDIQRYGMGLPQVQADPTEMARMNAMAIALQGLGAGDQPITPDVLRSIVGAFGANGNDLLQQQAPSVAEDETRSNFVNRARQTGLPEPEIGAAANQAFGDPNAGTWLDNPQGVQSSVSGLMNAPRWAGRAAGASMVAPFIGMPEMATVPQEQIDAMEQAAASGDQSAAEWLKKYYASVGSAPQPGLRGATQYAGGWVNQ